MLSLRAAPLRRSVSGADVYLVPRGDVTLVGSTLERVGFDATTTSSALSHLHEAAGALCPELANAPVVHSWAGLRPVTPDFLPVIGRDPEFPALLYACGHAKNGILMAPLTGECVAALINGSPPPIDLGPFAIERFA
jgi:glycine oxidase